MTTTTRPRRMRRRRPRTMLTPREREVLRLWVGGSSVNALAEALTISTHTAKKHLANVVAKLGVEGGLIGVLDSAFACGYLRWSDDCPWFR